MDSSLVCSSGAFKDPQSAEMSHPLNVLIAEVKTFLPKLLRARTLLGVAWILATLTKIIVTCVLLGLRIDERLQQVTTVSDQDN